MILPEVGAELDEGYLNTTIDKCVSETKQIFLLFIGLLLLVLPCFSLMVLWLYLIDYCVYTNLNENKVVYIEMWKGDLYVWCMCALSYC